MMSSCFVAQPSVLLGATPSRSAIIATRIRSGWSDAGSSSYCFTWTRELTSVSSIGSVECVQQGKLGYFRGTMSSPQHAFYDERGNSSLLVRARRKSRGGDGVQQSEPKEELDEDLQAGLNEISTEALKAMLSEDDREVAQVRQKVEYLGKYLVQEEQLDAARFLLILRGMLDHEVVPQKDDLKGAYKKAFDTIASVIEDSGWVLKQEGADVGGVEMVDDELMPPVLNSQY